MTLEQSLSRSAEELRHVWENLFRLAASTDSSLGSAVALEECANAHCSCRKQFRATLAEVIDVLDDTRRSFKSKQLAELRKKLMHMLAEQG